MSLNTGADNKEAMDVDSGKKETNNALQTLTQQMMNDPKALAMMQSRLDSMVGNLSGYYDTLPETVKRRVRALKKIQVDYLKVEAKFHQEIHAIECKYNELYKSLYAKRSEIVNASYEPNDEECDFPSDESEDEDEESGAEEGGDKKEKKKVENPSVPEDAKGIPEFWLTIFKNIDTIAQNIQDHDEPILKHLKDITLKMSEQPLSFTLEFHFEPNEYFSDTVLTKTYLLKNAVDEKDPFSFEGPEIEKAIGCKINWNSSKNVTVKCVTKKQKHRSRGSIRTVAEEQPTDSFFNFFAPPEIPENENDIDDDTRALIAADFEIGEIIRHRLVPRAVLYFTGEALMDEEEDFEDDDDEEDEDFDEGGSSDDSEDEANEAESGGHQRRKFKGNRDKKNPQECQQQ